MMKQYIILQGKEIKYNLEYKKVKNINLRIKPDGKICVSANGCVKEEVIEAFLLSKADFILRALKRYEQDAVCIKYFEEEEIADIILKMCEELYPYFKNKSIDYPEIKFRKMVSRWGSCHTKKRILTFNTNLMYAPQECIEYVVMHEFTHFLQANHSKKFYDELAKICPDWKERRKLLKEIILR